MESARRYLVSGRVQGVGFRWFAQREANGLGVAGYVKNLRDGRVEVFAIAEPGRLAALRAQLEQGPGTAHVERVKEEEAAVDARYLGDFVVEF